MACLERGREPLISMHSALCTSSMYHCWRARGSVWRKAKYRADYESPLMSKKGEFGFSP